MARAPFLHVPTDARRLYIRAVEGDIGPWVRAPIGEALRSPGVAGLYQTFHDPPMHLMEPPANSWFGVSTLLSDEY